MGKEEKQKARAKTGAKTESSRVFSSLKSLLQIMKRPRIDTVLEQLKNSLFFPLLNQLYHCDEKKQNSEVSYVLVSQFCEGYSKEKVEEKARFEVGSVSVEICVNEVARALAIPNSGGRLDTVPDISKDDKTSFTEMFEGLLKKVNEDRPKKTVEKKAEKELEKEEENEEESEEENIVGGDGAAARKTPSFNRNNLKKVLLSMSLEGQENQLNFLKLFHFYIIEAFLLSTPNKACRMKYYKFVHDLNEFNKINWAKATFDGIIEGATKVVEAKDADIRGCSAALEHVRLSIWQAMSLHYVQGGYKAVSQMLNLGGALVSPPARGPAPPSSFPDNSAATTGKSKLCKKFKRRKAVDMETSFTLVTENGSLADHQYHHMNGARVW